jgi:hypothetical protein
MRGPEEWLSTTEPGLTASFTFLRKIGSGCRGKYPSPEVLSRCRQAVTPSIRCNCLIFKHNYLMRYFQYAQYPIVLIDLLP